MATNEEIIVNILKESGATSQENMITPAQLIEKCKEKGVGHPKEVEAAVVSLIDQDIVEYEMDDKLQTSELWLLQ